MSSAKQQCYLSVQPSLLGNASKGQVLAQNAASNRNSIVEIGSNHDVIKFHDDSIIGTRQNSRESSNSRSQRCNLRTEEEVGYVSIVDANGSIGNRPDLSSEINTPCFNKRSMPNRGVTQQNQNRKLKQNRGRLAEAMKTDSIFASIMSDSQQAASVHKKVEQDGKDKYMNKRVFSQLGTTANSKRNLQVYESTRASSIPRNRNQTAGETDFINLNKRMQSLSNTMGREGTMGNSAYKKHIEAAGSSAFHLTKIDDTEEKMQPMNQRFLNTAQTPSYTPMQSPSMV